MPQRLSIVIIDEDKDSRNAIERMLASFGELVDVVDAVTDFQEGVRVLQNSEVNLVVLGVSELEAGIDCIRHILSLSSGISIFVTTREKNADWILRLIRAGATEYLLKPVQRPELAEALNKMDKLLKPSSASTSKGKVISVYNPTGGMGTTTIAVNLATALANRSTRVALIDLNLVSGDVGTFLDLTPRYTLSDVTENVNRLDANFLMSVMTRHSSGVHVLSEPPEVEQSAAIKPEQIQRVLFCMKEIFSHIVIDAGGPLLGTTNATAFSHSDQILFTTVLTLTAVKNARRYLSAMEKQEFCCDGIKIIANRYLPKSEIKPRDAEKVLNKKVFMTIPNEYTEVEASINKGIPLVNLFPKSSVSASISDLAGNFL